MKSTGGMLITCQGIRPKQHAERLVQREGCEEGVQLLRGPRQRTNGSTSYRQAPSLLQDPTISKAKCKETQAILQHKTIVELLFVTGSDGKQAITPGTVLRFSHVTCPVYLLTHGSDGQLGLPQKPLRTVEDKHHHLDNTAKTTHTWVCKSLGLQRLFRFDGGGVVLYEQEYL